MKTEATTYGITATYSYYSGTFHAPKNGALHDHDGNRLEFDSREDAEAHLIEQPELTPFGYSEAMGLEKNEDGSYSAAGTYVTRHGEYARPVYRIRKMAR